MIAMKKSLLDDMSPNARDEACVLMAGELRRRFECTRDFHNTVRSLVEELRSAGYDLWSFDEDDDFEIWGPNYRTPTGPGIVVTFRLDEVTVEWVK
jgi:hypothetical protein